MAFMAVEVCIWHLWLLSSMYVIDGCGGLYMAFMTVEVCIWHLWLQSSIYVIDSCGGLYMAFMTMEVCICKGPIYVMDGILVVKAVDVNTYYSLFF